ncbi:MAG: putative toxin-antitoxin system toxin component, PIN family [Polyangiaceae bacterium]
MRIVLDTNVVVSGLLSAFGPPAQIVDLVSSGDVRLVVDERILEEYRDVLTRPQFRLDAWDLDAFLSMLDASEHVIGAPLPFALSDPDDEPFLEIAIAGAVDALVTGNEKHFKTPRGRLTRPIMTPRHFLDLFSGR